MHLLNMFFVSLQRNPELRTAQKRLAEQVMLLVHGGTAEFIQIALRM
jgi:hypothetical protein